MISPDSKLLLEIRGLRASINSIEILKESISRSEVVKCMRSWVSMAQEKALSPRYLLDMLPMRLPGNGIV